MTIAARVLGTTYREYVTDFNVLVRGQAELAGRFGVEVLSVCSDPVSELADYGGRLVWFDNDPPAPDPSDLLLASPDDLANLVHPDPAMGRMGNRLHAVEALRRMGGPEAEVLGWVEGPISGAAVMRGMVALMEDLVDDPRYVADLFGFVTDTAIVFAKAQIDAGADVIGFGDAPASLIGPDLYEEFVLPFERRMTEEIHQAGAEVRMHICGNTTHLLPLMAQAGVDRVDIDSLTDFKKAVDAFPPNVKVLGNLDPVREVLNGTPDSIKTRLAECHRIAGDRYVIGAGCEIPAKTSDENLLAFAAYARECV
jgi:MtaA/CmuA family methyltransferase